MPANNPKKLRKLYWVETEKCNLECRYCYYNTALKQKTKTIEIPIEKKLELFNSIPEYFDEIVFTGGEALTDPDIFTLIAAAKKQGLKVDLLSNGVLLTTENCQKIISLGVDCVSISLDSLDEQTNDYLRGKTTSVIEGINRLLKMKSPTMAIEIMMTVTRKNISSIREMVDFCYDNNLNLWLDPAEINPNISRVKPLDLTLMSEDEKQVMTDGFSYWIDKLKKPSLSLYVQACLDLITGKKVTNINCDMGTTHFVLNPKGELNPCFSREDINYGNVFEVGLSAVMNNSLIIEKQPQLQKAVCLSLGCVCMTMVNENDPYQCK